MKAGDFFRQNLEFFAATFPYILQYFGLFKPNFNIQCLPKENILKGLKLMQIMFSFQLK